ncbi:FAD dependent oxidoreductase superfamily protein [Diaporthe amygdali]|uniref:FAD dependent oxidoreductase superfamily protein n=1 Tax=Phomopsis amygdali TaxID=1214568 RepID=UPI0022FE1A97|nr:FAD dependent oxidoreductase superfamily protein [Diaporthe amygdali]KAJ0120437.1 FAD dependent oxidoreductase superfamily protein [Diaporthe amygdali]
MSDAAANPKLPASTGLINGLPVDNPCLSFWQQTTRSFPDLLANSESSLPPTAKYLVIGSGISGALTAFELIHSAGVSGSDVVILEAREAASGASSRNAGHVRPDAFRGFQVYQRIHGTEQALKIIANERDVLHKIDAFVNKHDVPCDFNLATTLDVCLTPEFAEFNARSFKEYQEAGGDLSHVKVYEGEEASRRTGIKETVSAYEWPAGSSHPAKLAQWLLSQSIAKGAIFFTQCPALKVSKSSDVEARWDIETPKGIITAETVVHCTNGFAGHLIAQVAPYVTPTRAQALSFVPPMALSGKKMLASTMSLRYSLHNFYSVMQRKADGILILGASRKSPNLSQETVEGMAKPDDTTFIEEIKQDIVANFEKCFPSCENGRLRHGEGAQHTWTGVLGMTTDSVPFVGSLNGLPGQYVCAGFNGHGKTTLSIFVSASHTNTELGMARIFNCAPAVVKIIHGANWSDTGLPECFDVTEERLQRLSQGSIESVF